MCILKPHIFINWHIINLRQVENYLQYIADNKTISWEKMNRTEKETEKTEYWFTGENNQVKWLDFENFAPNIRLWNLPAQKHEKNRRIRKTDERACRCMVEFSLNVVDAWLVTIMSFRAIRCNGAGGTNNLWVYVIHLIARISVIKGRVHEALKIIKRQR